MIKYFYVFLIFLMLTSCAEQINNKIIETLNEDGLSIEDGKTLFKNQFVHVMGFYYNKKLLKIYVFDKDFKLQFRIIKEGFFQYGEKLFDIALDENRQFTFSYNENSFSFNVADENNNEIADNLVFLLESASGKYDWPY